MEKRYVILENKLCKELGLLEEKYRTGAEMSEGDLRKIDLLTHAMKSLYAYTSMKAAEDMQGFDQSYNSYGNMSNGMNGASYQNSYTRGRDAMGRYTSRDMGPDMSGHYPFYPEERRW